MARAKITKTRKRVRKTGQEIILDSIRQNGSAKRDQWILKSNERKKG